jgi:hypothetical protein
MRNQLNLPWADIPEVTDLVHYHEHHHSDSGTSTSSFNPQTLATALSAWYRYRYRYHHNNNDAQGGSLPRDNIALGIIMSEDHHRMGDDDSYRGVLVYVDADADADSEESSFPVMTTTTTTTTTIWIYHEAAAGTKGDAAGGEFTTLSVFHPLRAAEEELGMMARIRSLL